MRGLLMAAAAWAFAMTTPVGAEVTIPPPVIVTPLAPGQKVQNITLTRAVVRLEDGQAWGTWGAWSACDTFDVERLRWDASKPELKVDRFNSIFTGELKALGFRASNGENLFEADPLTDALQIAMAIDDLDARICSSDGKTLVRGALVMKVEWQLYDPVKREMVGKIRTVGGGEQKRRTEDGFERIVFAAFKENVRALLADPRFRELALVQPGSTSPFTVSNTSTPITLVNALPVAQRSMADAAGSVVVVFTGGGSGSGFLISTDGYVLTNHHVVGDAKQVRIRWSDGFEALGEVVRTHKARDVALIKADPHSRQPLTLRRGLPPIGETVYAIGTPLAEEFQNTLTKGVVSATRIDKGFSFIQSDVAVDHGNSGGPLLDEKGAVVGITDWGYAPDGVSHNLNFFIPIGDALDFLSLKSQP